MADDSTKLAQRLLSISKARPVVIDPPRARRESDRGEARFCVYRHARLILAGGAEIPCTIVDTSENGARVQLDGAGALPDFVILKVAATGNARRARVVWKRDNSAGLSFKTEQGPRFAAPPPRKLTKASPSPANDPREGD